MIRVRTGSRLHFGLFSLPSEQAGPWLNQEGEPTIPRRQFGGVGLMIDQPGIEVTVEEAKTWSAEGVLAKRALSFAQSYCRALGIKSQFRCHVMSAAPEHAGLGTGTQLGLAVAQGIAVTAKAARDAGALAKDVGRGLRSALGIHGFERGGFLVEGGKRAGAEASPLIFRRDFPPWPIVLITLHDLVGMHGMREIDAFAGLARNVPDNETTEMLCRLILLNILPALEEGDRATFGEAVYDFNRRSGALFKGAQGGLYAHPRIESIVKSLREFGVKGVGQSSWGPTVFAFPDDDAIERLCTFLIHRNAIVKNEITITMPCNRGAALSTGS